MISTLFFTIFGFCRIGQVSEIWRAPGAALIIERSYYSLLSEARRRQAQNEENSQI
jgi:hypothetical protein